MKQPKRAKRTAPRPATAATAPSKIGLKADPRAKQFQQAMVDALRRGPQAGKTIFS
jgi:hypothetical protein